MSKVRLPKPAAASRHYPAFTRVYKGHALWPLAQRTFKQRIEPIYGDQSRALRQIEAGEDRSLELMHMNLLTNDAARSATSEVDGVLLYKKVPTAEYERIGLTRSLEIKTLCLVPLAQNGRGGGRHLVARATEVSIDMNALDPS